MRKILLWLPLALFGLLLGIMGHGILNPEQTTVPSKLIGTQVPQFDLPAAVPVMRVLRAAILRRASRSC